MNAIKIKEGIYWVGAIDWDLRNFHGYLTQRGSTYNAYLIIDEKITLIDTVKSYKTEEMFQRIRSIIDPSRIDYIICNHVEMDHSGAIPAVKAQAPNATVFASPNGEKGLKAHFKTDLNIKAVKSGEVINLGKRNLHVVATPMVHWPDNMVCYCPEEKILFSNDSFGQHFASAERFDDEAPLDIAIEEARKYYANIVLPYNSQVVNELEVAATLDIQIIAPSHGIIWRKHIKEIVDLYKSMAGNKTVKKAVIIYDTMWHSTETLAREVVQSAFEQKGFHVVMRNLQCNHISDIMTDLVDAEYICVGSPTLNNNMLPNVAAFLTYLKGLSPKGRKSVAFGSYGWGGQSIGLVEQDLLACGFEVKDVIKVKYIPDNNDIDQLKASLISKIE